ncbi:DUF305 domain-containing protein [Variovorax sp. ZS18.2.2]|uniref:DUF305 domain-containing protein n=1 Tax=Variovorax sp. ZS18.2.2 TaxID=2971255 RepID=UPI002151D963|nr:DUF305 domain-containing protein [Variovorax sp. ZS18.2.2]MCR6478440.1 DUF305 domain-containing protein [Variovorax sp. ZS18.2.2]
MTSLSFKTLASASALAAFALTATAQTQPSTSPAPMAMSSAQMQKGGGSDEMKKSMMSGMDGMQKMQMSGDTDKDFAMLMKMHHQQALEMAKPEIAHGKSPELRAMARKIIKDQTKEIAQLDAWMKKNP